MQFSLEIIISKETQRNSARWLLVVIHFVRIWCIHNEENDKRGLVQAAVAQNISPAIANTTANVNGQSSCNRKVNSRIFYAKQHGIIALCFFGALTKNRMVLNLLKCYLLLLNNFEELE